MIHISGDAIIFEGEQAARISSRLYATQRDRFEDALQAETKSVVAVDGNLDVLIDRAKGLAQAGMVEIGELERIVKELKETTE